MTSLVPSLFLICFDHLNVFDTPSGPCVVQRLFLYNVWDRSPSDYNFKQTLWKRRSCCHWCIWWERLVTVIHFTVLHLWSVIYYISKGLVFISFMVGIAYNFIWLTFMTFMVSVTFVVVITLIILWVMQILMEHKM